MQTYEFGDVRHPEALMWLTAMEFYGVILWWIELLGVHTVQEDLLLQEPRVHLGSSSGVEPV